MSFQNQAISRKEQPKRQNSYYLTEQFLELTQRVRAEHGVNANRLIEIAVFKYVKDTYPTIFTDLCKLESTSIANTVD